MSKVERLEAAIKALAEQFDARLNIIKEYKNQKLIFVKFEGSVKID